MKTQFSISLLKIKKLQIRSFVLILLTVTLKNVAISQNCTNWKTNPTEVQVGSVGTSPYTSPNQFNVTRTGGCNCTAVSNDSWIHVTHVTNNYNNTVTVTYKVDSCHDMARTGFISINDQFQNTVATFTIKQDSAICSFDLPNTRSGLAMHTSFILANGGAFTFEVVSVSNCQWTASSTASWLHTSSSGAGNGTCNFIVEANTSYSPRFGDIFINGNQHRVYQDGSALQCATTGWYDLSSPSAYSTPSGSEIGIFSATSPPPIQACPWTAVSMDSWIHTTSSGNGFIQYHEASDPFSCSVDSNFGNKREGAILILNHVFGILQAGSCVPNLLTSQLKIDDTTGTFSVGVSFEPKCYTCCCQCTTTISSTDSWINGLDVSFSSGSYDATAYFTVTRNHGQERIGHIQIGDKTLTVIQAVPKIKAELRWDYSFSNQSISPKGVAADGVSRIYLKVSTGNTPAIQSVKVSLSNGVNSSTSMLGKVQMAATINSYSTEANNANHISVISNTSQNGDFWFWYVAPDDFSNDSLSPYANIAEREVTAHVVIIFTDGTKDSTDVPIKIVRPPLVMVHGIASSGHQAWKNFNYGSNTLFINSPLFKQKRAVNLLPHAPYETNANMLLSPDETVFTGAENRSNTLQGNIEELRKQGYACNQLDYVCHSMGGCVLRTAISTFPNKFYGTDGGKYRNYGSGFVHKLITINTPHNNTPIADAVTEFIPQASWNVNALLWDLHIVYPDAPLIFDYIESLQINNPFAAWQSTLAVKNLQVSDAAGGINLASTYIKHHLIAGDVNIYNAQTASILADLDKYMELLNKVLEIMRDNSQGPVKTFLTGLLALGKTASVLTFIEWYSQQKGYPNFLGDGDLAVPLSSQLANTTGGFNFTVFNNNSLLDANHATILSRNDVGNRVKTLLNSAVNTEVFGSLISSTPALPGNRLFLNQSNQPVVNRLSSNFFDTSKIKIITPISNSLLPADSTRTIQIKLKDTVNMAYISIIFQGKSYRSVNREAIQTFPVKIDSSFIGKMSVSATAVYDRANGTDYYTDTLTVNVTTNATLTVFIAKEDTNYIRKDYPFYPTYTVRYTNYDAGIPANSPDLIVTVSNPSIVQYNTTEHAFYAIADTGTTNAIINYKGFKDTIAFVLLPNLYSGCVNRTTGNATLKASLTGQEV